MQRDPFKLEEKTKRKALNRVPIVTYDEKQSGRFPNVKMHFLTMFDISFALAFYCNFEYTDARVLIGYNGLHFISFDIFKLPFSSLKALAVSLQCVSRAFCCYSPTALPTSSSTLSSTQISPVGFLKKLFFGLLFPYGTCARIRQTERIVLAVFKFQILHNALIFMNALHS
uniref:Uncharacterized protein n=1 Tax=Glossina austeni TaxID=7395 RepID=A0A1A9VLS5_GLOAU